MPSHFLTHLFRKSGILPAALLLASASLAQAADVKLRLVCVNTREGTEEKVSLASRADNGKWREHGEVALRPSLVSDWLSAPAGELHLVTRDESGETKSLASFTTPEGARHAFVAVVADRGEKIYQAQPIHHVKAGFKKGTILVLNHTTHAVTVSLGEAEHTVEAAQQLAANPALEENGMYRLLVSYPDAEGNPTLCHDRQTSATPTARTLLFLGPDETSGVMVHSLPIFGDPD